MKKERILLFGGTFDPPHNGHMNNLRAAIAAVHPDRVLVMPAGIPPHKAASATPAALRLAMCACFAPLHSHLTVEDWEVRREGKSYTIDTLGQLHTRWPKAHLYLNIGSDMLLEFTAWRSWQQILRRATLVVQSRQDGDAAALRAAAAGLRAAGGHIVFAEAPAVELSSTQVRAGQAGPGALPPEAEKIAREHHLYGYGKGETE